MKKTSICLHHTAIYAEDDVAEQFDTVDKAHNERWQGATKSSMGYYGGYHYIIERNGAVQQFRNDWEVGAHNDKGIKWIGAGRYSANYYAIGVCFAGNMSRQPLTDKQIKAGYDLIVRLQKKYLIPDDQVLPHRHYKATQCPGNTLPDPILPYLKEMYEKNTDWKAEAQAWAMANKISNGERPEEVATRVEVWQMLKNFSKL